MHSNLLLITFTFYWVSRPTGRLIDTLSSMWNLMSCTVAVWFSETALQTEPCVSRRQTQPACEYGRRNKKLPKINPQIPVTSSFLPKILQESHLSNELSIKRCCQSCLAGSAMAADVNTRTVWIWSNFVNPLGKRILCMWPFPFIVNLNHTCEERWAQRPDTNARALSVPCSEALTGVWTLTHTSVMVRGNPRTCKPHTERTWIRTRNLLAVWQQC